jgi:dsRNA-specific ribonuclease
MAVVSVNGTDYGAGEGRSKKQAEQAAAEVALEALSRDRT